MLAWSDDFYWQFLPIGYLFTVTIEAPILLLCLSRRLSDLQRLGAGFWLTACTYPIVVLVLAPMFEDQPRWLYLAVAETFAPVAECLLFWGVFGVRKPASTRTMWRDFAVITAANLASFTVGEWANNAGWFLDLT